MIGADLVNTAEFERQIQHGDKTFLQKTFTASELRDQRVHHLAGLWAAKEAVIKAAGAVPQKMTEILVPFDSPGRPHRMFSPPVRGLNRAPWKVCDFSRMGDRGMNCDDFVEYVANLGTFKGHLALSIRPFIKTERLSYKEPQVRIYQTAQFLASMGAESDDSVMVIATNSQDQQRSLHW